MDEIVRKKRNTWQKALVYEAACRLNHPSAEDVFQEATKIHTYVSKATVYHNLSSLVEDGKLIRINGMERAHYDYRTEPHYHAVCIRCLKVRDVTLPYAYDIRHQAAAEEEGFKFLSYEILFRGICKECQEKENTKWN